MKLKRYVLLENNEIYDLEKQLILGDGREEVGGYLGYELKIGSNFTTTRYGDILKTSDNILDLVEAGDLVKGDTACIFVSEVTGIYDEEIQTLYHLYWKKEIDTIYKKQPNGDYKKYEVQK